jgi:hypothetical protein
MIPIDIGNEHNEAAGCFSTAGYFVLHGRKAKCSIYNGREVKIYKPRTQTLGGKEVKML